MAGAHPLSEPSPPAYHAPDKGAGSYNSLNPSVQDFATKYAAEAAAVGLQGKWPHASENLLHFLENSGSAKDQDVDAMLQDCPKLRDRTHQMEQDLASEAVAAAKAAKVKAPLTFPINTPWSGYYIAPTESQDWFYATGGMSYNRTGYVTVYPPSHAGGAWHYEMKSRVNIRDQYNWDGNKSTDIGPINVTDKQLARLHRTGLAREYTLKGRGSETTVTGDVP